MLTRLLGCALVASTATMVRRIADSSEEQSEVSCDAEGRVKGSEYLVTGSKFLHLVIDVQKCFLPGGSLPVNERYGYSRRTGKSPIVEKINAISGAAHTIFTKDVHDKKHISFAGNYDELLECPNHGGEYVSNRGMVGVEAVPLYCCGDDSSKGGTWLDGCMPLKLKDKHGNDILDENGQLVGNGDGLLTEDSVRLALKMGWVKSNLKDAQALFKHVCKDGTPCTPSEKTDVCTSEKTKIYSQTLWPNHCVVDADLNEDLLGAETCDEYPEAGEATCTIVEKGKENGRDSYSAYQTNDKQRKNDLFKFLQPRDEKTIVITGIATDFCVLNTARDLLTDAKGYTVILVEDATNGIYPVEGALWPGQVKELEELAKKSQQQKGEEGAKFVYIQAESTDDIWKKWQRSLSALSEKLEGL